MSSEQPGSELARLGLTEESSALEFVDAVKARLSRAGKFDTQLDELSDKRVELHGVFFVSDLLKITETDWSQMLVQAKLLVAWLRTITKVLGCQVEDLGPKPRLGGTPLSAAFAPPPLTIELEPTVADSKYTGCDRLGARLKAAGELDGVMLPPQIFDAIEECPDPTRYAITYNDFKAVLRKIFKWTIARFNTVRIDVVFARHLEKQLVKRVLALPQGRVSWAKSILDRFENGRRATAKVCPHA